MNALHITIAGTPFPHKLFHMVLSHEQQWNKNERYGSISQSPAATPSMCVFQRGSRARSGTD
jgi:hypothetical protein